MSIPVKHHYLPAFFIARWATGSAGKVTAFRRPWHKLDIKEMHPNEIGYEIELYATKTRLDPAERQAIELQLMSPVDGDAATALDQLTQQGVKGIGSIVASDWARFMMSLLYRNPTNMRQLRELIANFASSESAAEIERQYLVRRTPNDPATLGEYIAQDREHFTEEGLRILLPRIFDSKIVGPQLLKMQWHLEEIAGPYSLLTGDNPIVVTNGIAQPDAFLLMPVSPTQLFIAANQSKVVNQLLSQRSRLCSAVNSAIVQQSRHVIIARDASQARFVENRFNPSAPLPGSGNKLRRHTWSLPKVDQ
jgi:hypothetical protein